MSSNPAKLPLSELLELIIDHRGKTPNKMGFDDFFLSGVPVLSAKHVKTDGLVDVQSMRYASAEMYKKWMKVEVQEGDIILTSEAPMGEVFYIQDDKKYVLGQRVFGLRPNPRLINPKYLTAWLASSKGQRQIAARASGSTVQGIRQSELLKLEVDLPSKEEQEIIANVRFSLTDKLSLNRSINQTLEAMAQAIFKSWFVDFDPVKAKIAAIEQGEDPQQAAMRAISGKTDAELDQMPREHHDQLAITAALFPDAMEESDLGEIPKGWKCVPASALIEFNPKEPLRKGTVAPYLDMASLPTSGSWPEPPVPRQFGSGMRFRNGDALLARITPCLENGKSAFVQNLPDETVGWGSTEFIVMRSKNPVPREYAYLLVRHAAFREHAIRSMTGTSGRQRAQADAVAGFKVVSPSEISVWFAFSRLLDSCFKVIKCQSEAVEKLAELRDTLLPQLFSGELAAPSELSDGEIQ